MVHLYRRTTKKLTCLGISGVLLFAFGFLMFFAWPTLFQYMLNENLKLKNNSMTMDKWRGPSPATTFRMYFFNVTNPDEIMAGTAKPSLVQMGPYSFKAIHNKDDVVYHDNNKTVSYKIRMTYYYDPELTNGTMDDVVTTLNVPFWSAVHMMRNGHWMFHYVVARLFHQAGAQLFIQRKVRNLLFEGYDDVLVKLGSKLQDGVPDKFGWMYGRNDTSGADGGTLSVYTGETGVQDIGKYAYVNYEQENTYFQKPCNKINGEFAGEMWPPERKMDNITSYSFPTCRKHMLPFQKVVDVKGIPAYRFAADDSFFAPNDCLCGPNVECMPYGVQNMSSCTGGSPVFISLPHFCHAHPSYLQAVDGLSPINDTHGYIIDVEPLSGGPVAVQIRFQVNLLLQPIQGIKMFSRLPRVVFPAVWMENVFEADDELVGPYMRLLTRIPMGGYIFAYVCMCLGALFIYICLQKLSPYVPLYVEDVKEKEAMKMDYDQPCSSSYTQ